MRQVAVAPPDPCPGCRLPDPRVEFTTAHQAEPRNVLPALARLLIGIDRQRRERQEAVKKEIQGE